MPANPKIVVRFDFPYDPSMAARFAREADIELRTCARTEAENGAWSDLGEAHVYLISSAKDELPRQWFATAELLRRCPKLLCVSTSGAGYDTVDVEACSKAGIIVVNQAGMNAGAVAEHTLGMMLALSKRIAECDRRLRRERGFAREDLMGREISGKVLGLVGIGHVGTRVARLAQAFAMTVLAYDPYLSAEEIARRGARSVSLDELLAQSDFVSIHCPRTTETVGLVSAARLALLPRHAVVVNTARGGIVDETALAAASALQASKEFFASGGNPAQRVDGSPPETATSLRDATDADTVAWYKGDNSAGDPREDALAKVDKTITVAYGLRANESGFATMFANLAALAAADFSAGDSTASGQSSEMIRRVRVNLADGTGLVNATTTEMAGRQVMLDQAKDRLTITKSTLADLTDQVEGADINETSANLLSLQTRLQASYEATAIVFKLNLADYL
jgi:D-3-phosphoglycerate dehydrogenase